MDFNLTEEQELFRKTVREFCDKKLIPRAREIDDKEEIPDDIIKEMAKLGLLGVAIPEDYGGPGGDMMMTALNIIEIGRGDISMATAVYTLLCNGWSFILNKYGTQKAKEEILPKVASGDFFIGISTTEASGGSDIANIKTVAKKEKGYYVINGEKSYISGVRETLKRGGGHLTIVKTAPELGTKGMSFIYVPLKGVEGITTTLYRDMGRMGLSTGGISFNNVKVAEHYLLGQENKGFYHLMDGFNAARILVSSACVGAAERSLELGMEYIKQRQAFGRPIGKFEAIQFELAEQYSQLEMAKLMVLKAAWLYDTYKNPDKAMQSEITKTVGIVKLYAPQIAFDTIRKVMNWYGAAGYTKDVEIEMGFRGVTSYVVGAEGALNIMKIIIGRELLGKEFIPYK